ncbi:MAG: transketolase family protein [Armatimonadota bacterium]
MRSAFAETLLEMARNDSRIMLVVGDLGFGVVTRFMEELPNQFVNAGVAEQNMTGLAAGLALSGRIVFTYSIANFPTLRCLEQIRNDVCYHNADVKVVAVGGGLAYGALGPSHHATEDIAVMRCLPNMRVLVPGDPHEARWAVKTAVEHSGPFYLRIGRDNEPLVHLADPAIEFGKAVSVREGNDVTLIAVGSVLHNTVKAAELLSNSGIQARVLSMPTVKPLDAEAVICAAEETSAVFTVEEHSIIGGLGGAVAEVLAEAGMPCKKFKRIGLEPRFPSHVGNQQYLLAQYGLDPEGIARAVSGELEAKLAPEDRNDGSRPVSMARALRVASNRGAHPH